jgi:hypothetical protein
MKKILGYILGWILYGLGDLISRPMQWFDWVWIYPIYNRLMLWSNDIQDWAGNTTPWSKIK